MAFFNFFSKASARYVSDGKFRKNIANQVAMAPETMNQLRQCGVAHDDALRLEYFFYTDTTAKAVRMADILQKKGYSVKHGPSAHDTSLQIVTGWTDRMEMRDAVVIAWIRRMCELGYVNDCNFDGWGTNPQQQTEGDLSPSAS